MDRYTFGKLFEINYNIQIHEGNANQRFCSQIGKISVQLHVDKIFFTKDSKNTKEFKLFLQMLDDIHYTLSFTEGRNPLTIRGRKNATIVKYIILLKKLELERNGDF